VRNNSLFGSFYVNPMSINYNKTWKFQKYNMEYNLNTNFINVALIEDAIFTFFIEFLTGLTTKQNGVQKGDKIYCP